MKRILLVEDDDKIRKMLACMLKAEHYEVLEATNGCEGSERYRQHRPDLLLTDLVMPDQNGIDMILELKKDFPGLRVVAISGGGGITGAFDYLPIARLIGARHVLQKPFGLQELKDAVADALEVA